MPRYEPAGEHTAQEVGSERSGLPNGSKHHGVLPEPVALISLEVERGNVVKDQPGQAEPGMSGAGVRQLLLPVLLRKGRQAPLQGPVGRRSW